jgi:hypothetical protein
LQSIQLAWPRLLIMPDPSAVWSRAAGLGQKHRMVATRTLPKASEVKRSKALLVCASLAVLVGIPVTDSKFVLAIHVAFVLLLWPPCITALNSSRELKLLWLSAITWAAAQALSSHVNGGDLAAATGYIGVLVAILVTIPVWAHGVEEIPTSSLCFAIALGWLGLAYTSNEVSQFLELWKFGVASPVAVLVLTLLWRTGSSRAVTMAAMFAFSATSLAADARFYALLGIAVALLVLLRGRADLLRASGRRLTIAAAAGVVLFYVTYPSLASAGSLGDRAEAQQEILDQTESNFIVDNRAEMFQAAYIVVHNPLLGTGAKVPVEPALVTDTLRWLDGIGVSITPSREAYLSGRLDANLGYAPHSGMLDSAIQGGLLTIPFWAVAIVILGRGILNYRGNDGGFALITFIGGLSVWNALFSPLDTTSYLGLSIALFLCLVSTRAAVPVAQVARRAATVPG